jgi:FKBP-type peptidyl-prolyl cis-trans isomerase FkpA
MGRSINVKRLVSVLGLATLFAFSAVLAEETKPKAETDQKADTATAAAKPTDTTSKESKVPEWTTTESGLKYRDIIVGKGADAKMGTTVNCHYTLWLVNEAGEKGNLVQSSKNGEPFQCTIGVRLIQGWSEGMVGMKEGGTRELIIHPAIGYGNKAIGGNMIPANSTLYFEIEYLNEVKK